MTTKVLKAALTIMMASVFDSEPQALKQRAGIQITRSQISQIHAAQTFVWIHAGKAGCGGIAEKYFWPHQPRGISLNHQHPLGHLIQGHPEKVIGCLQLLETGLQIRGSPGSEGVS
jgi:hypothetical protein